MRWLRTTASCLLIVTLGFATPAEAKKYDPHKSHDVFHGVMVDAYYLTLAHCETGYTKTREPVWTYQSRNYTGAFGIHRQTWRRWSGSRSAKGKTPQEQVRVADNIAFRGYTTSKGEFVYPVGVWGWGSVKANCGGLQRFICQSRHRLVLRWHRHCG